ncbi:MAG: hypothetical protein ACKOCT_19440, partial [Alphaproteobacteria bacterium]
MSPDAPWMLAGVGSAIAVAGLALRVARRSERTAARNAGLLVAGVAAAAAAILLAAALIGDRNPTRFFTTYGSGRQVRPYVHDPDLGMIHRPDSRFRAVKTEGSETLYDAI